MEQYLYKLIENLKLRKNISQAGDLSGEGLLETLKEKLDPEEFDALKGYIKMLRLDRDQMFGNLTHLIEVLLEILLEDEKPNLEA